MADVGKPHDILCSDIWHIFESGSVNPSDWCCSTQEGDGVGEHYFAIPFQSWVAMSWPIQFPMRV
jgi:hypothetical protein